MKKIKSKLLNKDFPNIKTYSKDKLNTTNKNNRTLSTRGSFNYKKNISSQKYFSFNKRKNPFSSNSNKNLDLINFYLSKNKTDTKMQRIYRTEIQTSKTIIRFPSYLKNHSKNNYNDRYITSYASSRSNSSIPKYFNINIKNKEASAFLEKCQTFVNLHILLGKRKVGNKIVREKYKLDSMRLRNDYANFILKNSLLSFKKTHDTAFAHNINSAFMLKEFEKLKKFDEKQKRRITRNLSRLEKYKAIDAELDDYVDPNFIDYLKIKKQLRNIIFFENQIKFKIDKNYFLFHQNENKMNYIYDAYHVPKFKNLLLKYNNEINYEIKYINDLNSPNLIDYKVWNYLNIKKAKIQELKDKGIYNDIFLEDSYENNSNISKRINLENQIKNDDNEEVEIKGKNENKKNSNINLQINEEIEDYFINKRIYKNNSFIASDGLKKIVYKKFVKV